MFYFIITICATLFFLVMGVIAIFEFITEKEFDSFMAGVFFIILFVVCIFGWIYETPPFLCPDCGKVLPFRPEEWCSQCGREMIPHCIDCGEICRTAFCKLCGAKQ